MRKYLLVALLLSVFLAMPVAGYTFEDEPEPYQLAILYPFQVVNGMRSIRGFRLNLIYGVNENMTGFDFGMINRVKNNQKGLQLGFFNSSFKTSGVQIGIINKTEYLDGLQIGFLNFHGEGKFRLLPIVNFAF